MPRELSATCRYVVELVASDENKDDTVPEASRGVFEDVATLEKASTLRARATLELLSRLACEDDRQTVHDYRDLCKSLRRNLLCV